MIDVSNVGVLSRVRWIPWRLKAGMVIIKNDTTQGEIVNADEIEETLRCLKKFLAMR